MEHLDSESKIKSSFVEPEVPSKSIKLCQNMVKIEPNEGPSEIELNYDYEDEQVVTSDPLKICNVNFKTEELSVQESQTNSEDFNGAESFIDNAEMAKKHLLYVEDFVLDLTQKIESQDIIEEHLIVIKELSKKIETIQSELSAAKDSLCEKLWNQS